jgi:ribosomal subunit interface protein
MAIRITGKHIEVGESLSSFIENEIKQLLETHVGQILEADIVITKEHHIFAISISIHVSRHFTAHCYGEDADPYQSFSIAYHKLERQIKKYRSRLRDQKRQKEVDEKVSFFPHYVLQNQEEDPSHAEDHPLVIAEKTYSLNTLTVSEAVMRLEMSESPLVVFRNAGSGRINIVYWRKDKNIAWLDTQA